MKFQFQLRSLMLFVVWIAFGLLVNFQIRQTDRFFYQQRKIIAVSYGQGWPLEYKELCRKEFTAVYVPEMNGWTFDPQSTPIELSEGSGEFSLVIIIIDAVAWLIFYVCLWKMISLVNHLRLRWINLTEAKIADA